MLQTHLGHGQLALEPTPYTVVNTLRFPPCLLHALVAVGLVAPTRYKSRPDQTNTRALISLEVLGALLDDRDLDHGGLKRRR